MQQRPHLFITGAAKRVGKQIALSAAAKHYDVTVHYRHSHKEAKALQILIQSMGARCLLLQGDLSEPETCESLIQQATEQLGAISLLVHNASTFEKDNHDSITEESFHQHMMVNLYTPLRLNAAYQQSMMQEDCTRQGHIVCLLDGMVGWSISPEFLSYSLSRLAMQEYIRLVATSLAPQLRINGIAAGSTLVGHMDKPNTFEKIRHYTPLQRNSSPEEVCEALWLLQASPSMTGQILYLSGGVHLPVMHRF